jgi:hypothetical protein
MVESMTVEWRFARGDATADEIQSIVDEVLAEVVDPTSEAAAAARRAGVDPADLAGARVWVREGAQGVEPVLTAILVGIAISAGSKVAETLWTSVIWPYVRRSLGAAAVGERVNRDEDR